MFKMTGVAVWALYSHVKDSEKTLIIRHALNTGNTSFLQVKCVAFVLHKFD